MMQRRPSRDFQMHVFVACALIAAFVLANPSWARPPGPPPDGGGPGGGSEMSERRLERIIEELSLADDVRTAVDSVLDASRVRGRDLRRRLRAEHAEMRELLDAKEPSEAQIFSQVDTITGLQAEIEKNRLGTLIRVRALLTPASRDQLLRLMKRGPPEGHHPPRRRPGGHR